MNIEAVKQKKYKLGRYELAHTEINELFNEAEKAGIDFEFNLAALSYTYGFIRGGNAERSKRINTKECEEAING